jgi:hypothetical protein
MMKRRNLSYGLPLQSTNGDYFTDMPTDSIKPTHYSRWKIEPIEFIRANKLDFARANIIKYIMRYDAKDGLKDLEKARQYLDWLIEDFKQAHELEEYRPSLRERRYRDGFDGIIMTEEDLVMAERALYEGQEDTEGQALRARVGYW